MRILITGGGGFIGRELMYLFARSGVDVIATIRNSRPEIPADVSDRITLVQADLAAGLELDEQVDLVVHAAADTHLTPGLQAVDYINSNLLGTDNVARFALKAGARTVVYLSAMSVYGTITEPLITEDTRLNKPGMYGISKYMGEKIIEEYSAGMAAVCLRLPGVVGKDYFLAWLGRMLANALHNKEIIIHNSNSLFNNIVGITDIYRYITHLVANNFSGFEVANLASEEPITIRKVIDILLAETKSRSPVTEVESDSMSFLIDTEKLKSRFGFQPRTTSAVITEYCRVNLV